jgi:hypothetical protein
VSNLVYLGAAAAFVVVASLVLVLIERRPKSASSSMDEFNRGLQALAPPPRPVSERVRSRRGSSAG